FPDCRESFVWTNGTGSTVTSGSLLRVNGRLCMAHVDIANGESGTVLVEGEFALVKGTGYTLAVGDALTYDGTKMVKKVATEATPADAYCTKAAATGGTLVEAVLASGPQWGGVGGLLVKKVASA